MTNNRLILIVDDEDAHRLLIKRALKPLSMQSIEARSVDEAIAKLQTSGTELGLVILDMNLAGASSLQFLEHIRAAFPFDRLPVVVLSTSALDVDVEKAYAAGVNCYLIKNIDPNEFRSILTSAIRFFSGTANS